MMRSGNNLHGKMFNHDSLRPRMKTSTFLQSTPINRKIPAKVRRGI
jgi:hypothetical protein